VYECKKEADCTSNEVQSARSTDSEKPRKSRSSTTSVIYTFITTPFFRYADWDVKGISSL
jgi:hypothetical protein